MIEIDQEVLDIIQSLGMGNLAWKWKTQVKEGMIEIDQERLGFI